MRRVLAFTLLLGALCCTAANAANTPNSIVTLQTPNRISFQLGATASCTGSQAPYPCCTGNAAGCVAGTNYTLYTAGVNGSRCSALWTNSSDNVTHALTFQLLSAAVTTKGPGTIFTTTASGSSGVFTVPQSINSATNWPGLPLDSDQNPYISLNSGDTLTVQFATAITAGNVINFSGSCGDF